jgi:lipopolysaccharide transport system permease protein
MTVDGSGSRLTLATAHDAFAPTIEIQPTRGWAALKLSDLWEYRELLYFLVWRDLKVRYKQTALGIAWVVIQPLLATAIFTLIFGYLVGVSSGSLPYPVFAFSGLVPWTYFAGTLTRSGTSLVSNSALITKVYFPRLLIPLSGALNGLVDLAVALLVLLGLMLVLGVVPSAGAFTLPLFVLLAIASALGVSLWLAALNVQYRDVNHILPFLVQVWMYATPIVYPSSLIPDRWRAVYALNPMVTVVEGFRWGLTGVGQLPLSMVLVSTSVAIGVLVSGVIFFRRTERTFADII